MKYFVATYGCQMNVHESEKLAGILEKLGYTLADNMFDADIVVFNTCCIRESAEQKIFGNIGELKKTKANRKDMIIAVCGCMSQQNGYADLLVKKFPFIDIVFGTHNLSKFEEYILRCKKTKKRVISIEDTEDIRCRDEMEKVRTSGVNAWVNIMYGCNNFCTYCIVPYVRGREVSRPMQDILLECEELLEKGYKQITLLGQNVNSYGNDINDENMTFAKLLSKIDALDFDFRLRFMTSHPKDLSSEVIDTIAASKHISHYIHLPFQSGSNKILKAMNRRYTREKYLATIEEIKAKIPDVQFSSDIIVGFPGETEEDFLETLDVVKQVGFEQLFMFIYSKRKGTVAEKMENQVDIKIKKERLARLIELEREIASNISQTFVGKIVNVLVEEVSPKKEGYLVGSLDQGKAITFAGDPSLIGQFVELKVTKAKLTSLFGEIIGKEKN